MKLVLFTRSLNAGGTERQMAMLALGLAGRGHDVAVVLLYGGGALEALLRGSAVRVLAVGKAGRWDVAGPLWRLRRIFRAERPDAIYAFLPVQTVLAALLRPKGARLVFGLRAGGMQLDRYDRLSALSYRLEALLARRADLVVANARAVRADAQRRGIDARRVAVVPNGIDTGMFRPDAAARAALRREWAIGDADFVVGTVARLDPMKDHGNFLEAAALFAREHADARFVIVGDGDAAYRDGLKAKAAALGIGGRVVWAGERRDLPAVYNALDLATLASAFGEGFSNVLGEAMACGTPVAATDVGDARDILGDDGAVAPPRDPAALARAWESMRGRPRDGKPRARIVATFGVDRMVARSEALLRAVIAGRPAGAVAREFAGC
ncbi:MAG: glycosyltransferase [Alphaproteobacteria bacterium]|nr:glycosyltransferase [Alphaproteobacteria bacterium]